MIVLVPRPEGWDLPQNQMWKKKVTYNELETCSKEMLIKSDRNISKSSCV